MKEVTYEDWLKNPVPRNMWVWDDDEKDKKQRKVVYVIKGGPCRYPVRTTMDDDTDYEAYRHCAEIEERRTRRMTNKELARWLREHSSREYKYRSRCNYASCFVYSYHTYDETLEDEEINKDVMIRENDGEWKEPLIEVTDD